MPIHCMHPRLRPRASRYRIFGYYHQSGILGHTNRPNLLFVPPEKTVENVPECAILGVLYAAT